MCTKTKHIIKKNGSKVSREYITSQLSPRPNYAPIDNHFCHQLFLRKFENVHNHSLNGCVLFQFNSCCSFVGYLVVDVTDDLMRSYRRNSSLRNECIEFARLMPIFRLFLNLESSWEFCQPHKSSKTIYCSLNRFILFDWCICFSFNMSWILVEIWTTTFHSLQNKRFNWAACNKNLLRFNFLRLILF